MAAPEARFPQLSERERSAVGSADEYAWDEAVKAPTRARPESVQFSVRVERDLLEGLQEIARRQEMSFSDSVRLALRSYLRNGGSLGLSNVVVTYGAASLLVQVPGQRAEVPANRRFVGLDERVPTQDPPEAVTSATV